jgi:hypothetical protein
MIKPTDTTHPTNQTWPGSDEGKGNTFAAHLEKAFKPTATERSLGNLNQQRAKGVATNDTSTQSLYTEGNTKHNSRGS